MILEEKYDYSDVMLVPRICGDRSPESRFDVNLRNGNNAIPLIAANMDGVGTMEMALELTKSHCYTALHKHYPVKDLIEFFNKNSAQSQYFIYSMGISDSDMEKYKEFIFHIDTHPMICIDVANGYTNKICSFIKKISDQYGTVIMAGNVVTPEGVSRLAEAGADIIKIGIGPGSVCTTRKMTGTGYPQFSAVLECAEFTDKYHKGIKIVADGGITCPGDAAKAFAAGADYVMIGGEFAGHDEGGGTPCSVNGEVDLNNLDMIERIPSYYKTHRKFYGMASKTAQDKYNGGVADYRASEGKEVVVPYRGSINNTLSNYLGGLRSACTYQGVKHLADISINAKFVRVSRQINNIFG